MDDGTTSFDTSSLFPTNINIMSSGGVNTLQADVGGTSLSVTSAPSGATQGYSQPIYPSFSDWLRRGHKTPVRGVILPGWMLIGGAILAYIFFKKRKV